ncbi:MAG: hypothetical protein R3327_05745 [Nitrosopumilaceae archaeon]|nr:hypothetical protein [Nitrosopumilaceae archaeon]
MNEVGVGEEVYQLRKKIQELTAEIKSLGNMPKEKPELIENTNILRINEHLTEVNDKQTELISAYDEYGKALEHMLKTVFEIQNDLKNLLREQTKLLSKSTRRSKK